MRHCERANREYVHSQKNIEICAHPAVKLRPFNLFIKQMKLRVMIAQFVLWNINEAYLENIRRLVAGAANALNTH